MTGRVEISKRLVFINSASSVITRLLSISVLIWMNQYLLKRITPEEYSLLPVIYSVMMFAPLITTILTSGIGRYIIDAYAKNDDNRVAQIVSTMVPLLTLMGIVFLLGGGLFSWYIDRILEIPADRVWDARVMMAMLMASTAITLPLSPFSVGFFVRQKFVLQNVITLAIELVRLGLLFTLLFGVSTRVLWVVTASVIATLIGQFVNVIISRRLVPSLRFRPSMIHWPIARELVSFGGWSFLGSLGNTIRSSADPLILNKLSTPLDVASFHLGSLVPKHLIAFSSQIRAPLLPALTAVHAAEDSERLKRIYLRGGRLALLGIMLPIVCLVFVAEPLMLLYAGPEYVSAATVLVLILVRFPLVYGNIMAPMLANAKAQLARWTILEVISQFANLGLTFVLVGYYRMGSTGSALSSLLVALAITPFLVGVGIKLAEATWKDWFVVVLVPGLLPSVITCVPGVAIALYAPPESWLGIGVVSAALGTLYCLLVGVILYFQVEDRRLIVDTLKKSKAFKLIRGTAR